MVMMQKKKSNARGGWVLNLFVGVMALAVLTALSAHSGLKEAVDEKKSMQRSMEDFLLIQQNKGPRTAGTTASTNSNPSIPFAELEDFLRKNPHSPGAHFVGLLREHLHFEPGVEAQRLEDCQGQGRHSFRDTASCFGGIKNRRLASSDAEKDTRLALWQDDASKSVYSVRRYQGTDRLIPFLGTQAACLPLMLAGYAASQDETDVVVELGPFAGLSSNCIVTGMLKNGVRHGNYFAFDSFVGETNFGAISRAAPWLETEHPEYTVDNSSFLFLWKEAVQSTYPTATGKPVYINKDSVNPKTLGISDDNHKRVSMLSIDSAKGFSLNSQLEGLDVVEKGTIVFLMDFELAAAQIKQVYGCLRKEHLLPVYTSWNMEHWGFVVTKDWPVGDVSFQQCYKDIDDNKTERIPELAKVMKQDLLYLGGLTDDQSIHAYFDNQRIRLEQNMLPRLETGPSHWSRLITVHRRNEQTI